MIAHVSEQDLRAGMAVAVRPMMIQRNLVHGAQVVQFMADTRKLLRPDDEVAYGDFGYLGLPERPEVLADENLPRIEFRINRRPSSLNVKTNYDGINWEKVIEH